MLTPQDKANLEQVIETLAHYCNIMNSDDMVESAQIMANQLFRTHPTLQQGIARLLEEFCHFASKNRTPDLRNQASVDWFKAVNEINIYLPVI